MLKRILLMALFALVLTCASFWYQRRGPELVVTGNLCGPNTDQFCYEPAFKGGFPLAYIYDSPGISVYGKIALVEDRFLRGRFLIDVLAYFLVLMIAGRLYDARRRAVSSPDS